MKEIYKMSGGNGFIRHSSFCNGHRGFVKDAMAG